MVCRFAVNARNERTTNKLIEYPTQTEDLFESVVCNKSVPRSLPSLCSLKPRRLLSTFGHGQGRREEQPWRAAEIISLLWARDGRDRTHSQLSGFLLVVLWRGNLFSNFASFVSYQFMDLWLLLTKISLNWPFYWPVRGKFYMWPKIIYILLTPHVPFTTALHRRHRVAQWADQWPATATRFMIFHCHRTFYLHFDK